MDDRTMTLIFLGGFLAGYLVGSVITALLFRRK